MSDTADSCETHWTPRHRGLIYCSPGCGIKCTKAAYDRAIREASALAERMGQGWSPLVWENLGWCYEVVKGPAKLSPSIRGNRISGDYTIAGYSCIINSVYSTCADAETPEDALGFALQEARTKMLRYTSDLNSITE